MFFEVVGVKSSFERLKEKDKEEVLSHLITVSHQQQLEDRRNELGQSKHYKDTKRKNVLKSLFNNESEGSLDLGWKIEKCRKYNIDRYLHPTRKILGPWWNRVIQDSVVLSDPKEIRKSKQLQQDYLDNKIDLKTFKRKSRKLKWVLSDDDQTRKEFSSFRDSIDEVNTKTLNRYLKKTTLKEPCQSLWCPNCRFVAKESYLQKVQTHLKRGRYLDSGDSRFKNIIEVGQMDDNPYDRKYEYNNDDIRHVTGVVGLFPVDSNVIKDLLRKEEKNRWKRIKRRLSDYKIIPSINDPWIESVYEFELVNWKFLDTYKGNKDGKKKKTIKKLMKRDKVGKTFLFVHFHALTNLSKEDINYVFQREYWIDDNTRVPNTNPVSGLYVQSLRKNNTFKENIEKLCSYPFKDPYRYKHTFIGDDYSNGEHFTQKELREMILLYQNVQGNNWKSLFRSLSITNIVERDKYSSFYTSDHPVWNIVDRVWIVDTFGYVFKYGWNPDQHPSFRKVNVVERVIDRTPSGRKYGWYKHMYPHKMLIYSNMYDDLSYYERWKPNEMTLWEYYNSNQVVTNESALQIHHRNVETAKKLNPLVLPNPKGYMGRLFKEQQDGERTIIRPYTSFVIDRWDNFFKMYESVEMYNWFIKGLGVSRKSLGYKRYLRVLNKSKGLGYVDKLDDQHLSKVTKLTSETKFDFDQNDLVTKDYYDEYKQRVSYEEWLERERFDTYPKNYRRNYLEDYGLNDEDVLDVIDEELDDDPLLLPPPNQ